MSDLNTYNYTINLTPYWTNNPNTVLNITYYTTSGYAYSATITGPGINTPISFPNNNFGFNSIVIPASVYAPGITLQYAISIQTNSSSLDGQVQNSMEIGTKSNGDAITYQGFLFSNDAGSDNDWNDCVISLALFNSSTDN
ncbi:hypothetical protein [Flavobacterium sp. HJJ]|uniref:hypothetical protein n=1 Tax=Flavobacterium sp. HJJ TaxID=2783792 RepID=UPI001889C61F|nr:hypothetical protein [Flavobacterium sp. HJJ]MBF4470179.1 hypothetical protein [Flavobacterium sp. HJJ]